MPLYFITKLFYLFEGQILLKTRHVLTCRVLLGGVDTLDAHFKKPIARQNKKYLLFSLLVFITF